MKNNYNKFDKNINNDENLKNVARKDTRDYSYYSRVLEKIAEGRWQVEGGMYCQADCNLAANSSSCAASFTTPSFKRSSVYCRPHGQTISDTSGLKTAV